MSIYALTSTGNLLIYLKIILVLLIAIVAFALVGIFFIYFKN